MVVFVVSRGSATGVWPDNALFGPWALFAVTRDTAVAEGSTLRSAM